MLVLQLINNYFDRKYDQSCHHLMYCDKTLSNLILEIGFGR
jgi:hypothetical protein